MASKKVPYKTLWILANMEMNFDSSLPHDGKIRATHNPKTNNRVGVTVTAHCLECASKLKVYEGEKV